MAHTHVGDGPCNHPAPCEVADTGPAAADDSSPAPPDLPAVSVALEVIRDRYLHKLMAELGIAADRREPAIRAAARIAAYGPDLIAKWGALSAGLSDLDQQIQRVVDGYTALTDRANLMRSQEGVGRLRREIDAVLYHVDHGHAPPPPGTGEHTLEEVLDTPRARESGLSREALASQGVRTEDVQMQAGEKLGPHTTAPLSEDARSFAESLATRIRRGDLPKLHPLNRQRSVGRSLPERRHTDDPSNLIGRLEEADRKRNAVPPPAAPTHLERAKVLMAATETSAHPANPARRESEDAYERVVQKHREMMQEAESVPVLARHPELADMARETES